MKPHSVPPVVLAGIALVVGLYHLSVFARSHTRRRDLTFGLYCLVLTTYDVAAAAVYEADVAGAGASWQRTQFVCAGLGLALFLQVLANLTHQPASRATRVLFWVYLVFAAVTAVERVGFTLTDFPDTKVIEGPFGWHIVYNEVALGPGGNAFTLSTLLCMCLVGSQVLALYRSGERRRAITLWMAIGVLTAGMINDAGVALGQIENMYVCEYCYLALIALLAADMSSEVVRAVATADALAENEANLRTILDAIADAVLATDALKHITRMNPAAENLLGWTEREALGRPVSEILRHASTEADPHGGSWSRRSMSSSRASTPPSGDGTLGAQRIHDRTGEERLVTIAEAPLGASEGAASGSVLVLHDVTQQRRNESKLAEAQRMEALGRIAAGVAHDFNNLLTPILGFAETSMRKLTRGDPHYEIFAIIADAAGRAANLTRQLLTFGRRQVLDVHNLDLNAAINDFLPLLRNVVRADIVIEPRLAPDLCTIRADRSQLEQLFMNLTVNAQDAMPRGGLLRFETANVIADDAKGPAGTGERFVSLRVSDTGTGIDARTRRHIFEPFFTTKDRGRGTGLGLATVHGIVQQHGGHIEVDSVPGQGTTFSIFLPSSDEIVESGAHAVAVQRPLEGGHELIMVVDDDALVRRFVSDVLRANGYHVMVAGDSHAALRQLESEAKPLDLLLSDLIMPGMNGSALSKLVRERHPGAACLFMTGYADPGLDEPLDPDRDLESLRKPFSDAELLRRVRSALDVRPR